jgi:hypothetical protein
MTIAQANSIGAMAADRNNFEEIACETDHWGLWCFGGFDVVWR